MISSMGSAERCLDFSLHSGQITRPFGERTVALPVMTRGGVVVTAREGDEMVKADSWAGVILGTGTGAGAGAGDGDGAGAVAVAVFVVAGAVAVIPVAVEAPGTPVAAGILTTSPVCSSTLSSTPISTGARRTSWGMMANVLLSAGRASGTAVVVRVVVVMEVVVSLGATISGGDSSTMTWSATGKGNEGGEKEAGGVSM
jgi:hypothetical protein